MQNPSARLAPRSSSPRLRTAALIGAALLVARSAFAYAVPIDINALHAWGSQGSGQGQFKFPSAIATRSGVIYVVDSYNNRVQEFDYNGTYLRSWPARAGDTFQQTTGIAVDQANGTVYIASANSHRIFKYDSSGGYVTAWGSYGSGNGQFAQVSGVAVGTDGNIYTVDYIRGLVQVFNPQGAYLRNWPVRGPTAIAASPDGSLYITAVGDNRILKYNLQGVLQDTWPVAAGIPKRIAVSTDGNILLVTYENNFRAQIFNSFGVPHALLLVTTLHNNKHTVEPIGVAFFSAKGAVVIENRGGVIPDVVKFSVP